MKGTTLGQVKPGSSFWFGEVRFTKYQNSDDEMVPCYIYRTNLMVHITNCAWVFTPTVYIVFKDRIVSLDDIKPLFKRFFLFKK
jgi:hypothetical protein